MYISSYQRPCNKQDDCHSEALSYNPFYPKEQISHGQKFIEHSVEKVRELRALIERTGSKALIEVDGGVNLETGARLVEAGADALVAGNAVFAAPDPEAMISQLHEL